MLVPLRLEREACSSLQSSGRPPTSTGTAISIEILWEDKGDTYVGSTVVALVEIIGIFEVQGRVITRLSQREGSKRPEYTRIGDVSASHAVASVSVLSAEASLSICTTLKATTDTDLCAIAFLRGLLCLVGL